MSELPQRNAQRQRPGSHSPLSGLCGDGQVIVEAFAQASGHEADRLPAGSGQQLCRHLRPRGAHKDIDLARVLRAEIAQQRFDAARVFRDDLAVSADDFRKLFARERVHDHEGASAIA